MRMKSILVMTDFSAASRQAILAGGSLARRFEADLNLVHLLASIPFGVSFSPDGIQAYPASSEGGSPENAWKLLNQAAADPALQGLPVMKYLLEGDGHPHLLRRCQANLGIDLTVLSSRGRNAEGKGGLGTFVEWVTYFSVTPVLLCAPNRDHAANGSSGEAFRPRRILAPFDFSDRARAGLDFVRLFSQAFGAHHICLLLTPQLPSRPVAPKSATPAKETLHCGRAWELDGADGELHSLLREELGGGVTVVTGKGDAVLDILKACRSFAPDLLIITMDGLMDLQRLFRARPAGGNDHPAWSQVLVLPAATVPPAEPEAVEHWAYQELF